MRTFIAAVLFSGTTIFSSCNQGEKKTTGVVENNVKMDTNAVPLPKTKPLDATTPFDAFLKEITFKYLYVFPDSNFLKPYPFTGKKLTKELAEKTYGFNSNDHNSGGEYFGVHKFKIDDKAMGMLVRRPGAYISSMVDLYVYNLESKTFSDGVNLADVWGDAGDHETKQSILFYDGANVLHAITHQHFKHIPVDEMDKKDKIEELNNYALVKITASNADTISKVNKKLQPMYLRMLEENF